MTDDDGRDERMMAFFRDGLVDPLSPDFQKRKAEYRADVRRRADEYEAYVRQCRAEADRADEIARKKAETERIRKLTRVPPSPERTFNICAARRSGKTLAEVGEMFSLSKDRIRQIVVNEERRQQKAQKRAHLRHRKSRPLDMGGIRDEWQHWTPEMQYMEFAALRGE